MAHQVLDVGLIADDEGAQDRILLLHPLHYVSLLFRHRLRCLHISVGLQSRLHDQHGRVFTMGLQLHKPALEHKGGASFVEDQT